MTISLLSMSGAQSVNAPLPISSRVLETTSWGVLYEVPDFLIEMRTAAEHNRKSLDAIEGEGSNYARCSIAVKLSIGRVMTAITYRVIKPTPDLRTNLEYVRHIVTGLREHGVADDYIAKVRAIATANNPAIASQIGDL